MMIEAFRRPDHYLPGPDPPNLSLKPLDIPLAWSRLEGSGIGSLSLSRFEVRQLRARVAKPAMRYKICVPVPGAAMP